MWECGQNFKRLYGQLAGNGQSLQSQVVAGATWRLASNGLTQANSFLRLAVLARFLEPSAFGLMAISTMVLSVLETFTTTGFDQALIRKEGEIDNVLPSVYLVNILRGLALGAAIWFASPYISGFFGQEDATSIVRSAAIIVAVRALKNPAVVNAHRRMQFKRLFVVEAASSVSSFIVAVALAPVLQNVWVLVISTTTYEVAGVIGTFLAAPWTPRLGINISMIRELGQFGRWVLFGGVVVFLSLQIDHVVVGRMLGASSLGLYDVAFRVSQLPSTQVTTVAAVAVYPALSKLAADPDRFRRGYLRITAVLFAVTFPITVALIVFADPVIKVFLGSEWGETVRLVQVLAIAGFFRSQVAIGGRVLYAVGKPQLDFLVSAARLLILGICLIPFAESMGIYGVAVAVVLSSMAMLAVYLKIIQKVLGLTAREQFVFVAGRYRNVLSSIGGNR